MVSYQDRFVYNDRRPRRAITGAIRARPIAARTIRIMAMGKPGSVSFRLVSIPVANAIARQNQRTPLTGPDVIGIIFRRQSISKSFGIAAKWRYNKTDCVTRRLAPPLTFRPGRFPGSPVRARDSKRIYRHGSVQDLRRQRRPQRHQCGD